MPRLGQLVLASMSSSGGTGVRYNRVTVFGGSGFLGRQIVRRLASDGAQVRVAVRHPERASFLVEASTAGQIVPVYADVWDEASVGPAVDGAEAVVNTVGHYVERGQASFAAIHGQGARQVARASAMAGVQRLVHVSGLGADPASASPYIRARGIGERLVKEAFPEATILRPSVLFGPEDAFLNRLAGLARVMPVLPLFGTGETRLQPVYVRDIAEAAAQALAAPVTMGKVYELGGPRVYTYKALVQLVLAQIERRRLLIPVPYFVWELLSAILVPLPNRPISRDQIILMKRDNVVGADALTFAELGIAPTSLEAILPTYLGQRPAV
jgi:uncharacterized protein YbjT (DUF2867 family)